MPSMYFNGSTYVSVAVAANSEPITMGAWVKVNDYSSARQIWDTGNGGRNEFHGVGVNTDGTCWARSRRSNSTIGVATSTLAITENEWAYVCGVFHGDADRRIYVYFRGKWEVTQDTTNVSQINFSDNYTRLGSDDEDFGNPMVGLIFAPIILTRAMSADEVRWTAFNPYSNRRSTFLEWRLNQGNPTLDYSENDRNGTITGTPFYINDEPMVDHPFTLRTQIKPVRSNYFGINNGWSRNFVLGKAPAGGGATIPIFDHHYRMLRSA